MIMRLQLPKFLLSFILSFTLLFNSNLFAQIALASWEMNALTNWGPSPYAATASDPNVIIGPLVRASGVVTGTGAAARAWGGSTWQTNTGVNTISDAIAANKFFTCSIKASAGYDLSVFSFNPLSYRRSSTGPAALLIQYSLDGTNFTDIGAPFALANSTSSGATLGPIAMSGIAALQNVPNTTTVTFRFIPHNATGTGTFYIFDVGNNAAAPDFIINGTTPPAINCITPGVPNCLTPVPVCQGLPITILGAGSSPSAIAYTYWDAATNGNQITIGVVGNNLTLSNSQVAGNYTFHVQAQNGTCVSATRQAVTAVVKPIPTAVMAGGGTSCTGGSPSITVDLTGTPPWDFDIADGFGGTNSIIGQTSSPYIYNNPPNGTYTVTGLIGAGCFGTSSGSATVNTASQPMINASATNLTVCPNGSTTLQANGADSYIWMPGNLSGASVSVNPIATTIYTVTGTASSGCTGQSTVEIVVYTPPNVTASANAASICNGQSSTLTGSGAATYSWQPINQSGNGISVSPTITTTYIVTGTDANGCSATTSVDVTVNNNPNVTASANAASICNGQSSTLTGSGAATYSWQPINQSGNGISVSPVATTTYTVTGTDGNGCSATTSVDVTVNDLPQVIVSANPATICNGASSTLSGSNAVSYDWQPINQSGNGISVSPVATTTYTVTGTDGNGCSATTSVDVTVNDLPQVTVSANPATICNGVSSTLSGSNAVSYDWQPINQSGNGISVSPVATTTYTVTGTDGNGCSATTSVDVTVNDLPQVIVSANPATICNGASSTLTGSNAVSYDWQPINQSGNGISVSPAATTTYTVTGTDGNGCSATTSVDVTVNAANNTLPSSNNCVILNSQNGLNDYNTNSCELIGSINSTTDLGPTEFCVSLGSNQTWNGQSYGDRVYSVVPTNNNINSTLCLNYTNTDLQSAGILNPGDICITKIGGNGQLGDPNNSVTVIPNTAMSITPITNGFEVCFDVNSFSTFYCHTCNPLNAPLAATIDEFVGKRVKDDNLLTWNTLSESNNEKFLILHSQNGKEFSVIANVQTQALLGNSNTRLAYSYTHKAPQLGRNFYRLQQVDKDGIISFYQRIVEIDNVISNNVITVYPNPVLDNLNLNFYATKAQYLNVQLVDLSGRVVISNVFTASSGSNRFEVETRDLASGSYILRVAEQNGIIHNLKISK
jgi:hypothetical protein